ncbi:MAG TPA: Zn-ribbon containing protein [Methanobacterium sp.]
MHRCIKCGFEVEGDLETIIIDGCPECGSKFFAYTKKGQAKETVKDKGEPVEKSVEGVMVKGQGVYEVNLSSLLENDSVIVSNEEGRYLIDINSLLKKRLKEDDHKG